MIFQDRLKRIKVIATDIDGVLTDGAIIYTDQGGELKFFNVKDGYAMMRAKKEGFKTAFISARPCVSVELRAKDLQVDAVYLNAYPKMIAFEDMLKKFNVTPEEVCFIGDDFPDYPILSRVGFSACPCDAVIEIRKKVHYVAKNKGGHGAVREIIEQILKAQRKWSLE